MLFWFWYFIYSYIRVCSLLETFYLFLGRKTQVLRAAIAAELMVAAVWAAEPATGRYPMLAARVAASPLKMRDQKQSR